MSQKWPLSQSANKSSGTCSICLATRQIHFRDGTIHRHGPRNNPCPGSNKPPLQSISLNSQASVSQSADISNTDTASALPRQSSVVWSPPPTTLIKHIPKSVRSTCASHLASLLRKVVANPQSAANWLKVFNWGHIILHQPKRGGRRHNLSSVIKRRLSAYSAEGGTPGVSEIVQQHKYSTATLSQAVAAKLEDGNVRAAVRMLMSDDSPASPSPEYLKALNEKHPAASSTLSDLPAPQLSEHCLSVDENEIRRAALSFPAGSAGGPDGVRPQHIRCLLYTSPSPRD